MTSSQPGAPCPEAALLLLVPVIQGLAAVHEASIVHRDVKPENVMVTQSGQVVIVDFGLAYTQSLTRYTEHGSVAGSVPYMSPEQIDDDALTGATDIWSWGVFAYELLVGRRPFSRARIAEEVCAILSGTYEPLERVNRRVADPLAQLISSWVLQNTPSQRPTAQALA